MSAEQWELLQQELRNDAGREIAATKDQSRKDSIRADLTSLFRLPKKRFRQAITKWTNAGHWQVNTGRHGQGAERTVACGMPSSIDRMNGPDEKQH